MLRTNSATDLPFTLVTIRERHRKLSYMDAPVMSSKKIPLTRQQRTKRSNIVFAKAAQCR